MYGNDLGGGADRLGDGVLHNIILREFIEYPDRIVYPPGIEDDNDCEEEEEYECDY